MSYSHRAKQMSNVSYSHIMDNQMCPIFLCSNFPHFFEGICVPSSRLFTTCVLFPGCVLFPNRTHICISLSSNRIWMCLKTVCSSLRWLDKSPVGAFLRKIVAVAGVVGIHRCRFPHRCPTRAAALQPPSTRRSTAAADEDVLLEFAWASPRRACWSTGRARASYSLRRPSHPCQRSQRQRTWAHCPRTWRQTKLSENRARNEVWICRGTRQDSSNRCVKVLISSQSQG